VNIKKYVYTQMEGHTLICIGFGVFHLWVYLVTPSVLPFGRFGQGQNGL
jgi:hypothetical protein